MGSGLHTMQASAACCRQFAVDCAVWLLVIFFKRFSGLKVRRVHQPKRVLRVGLTAGGAASQDLFYVRVIASLCL
jgi:hypothetical protein